MFCSKCGNPLPDDAKFCGVCGAPVNTAQEDSSVLQQPAGTSNETVNIQAPKPEPFMEAQNFSVQMSGGTVDSVKKSRKRLVIGLSASGVLLAVILAVVLICVFGLKGGSKGSDSFVSIVNNEVVCDDEYTYYLDEQETGDKAYIMRIGNQSDAKPEILYEADQIKGDGWGRYPLGALFLWGDKICFLEVTNASETTAEYGLSWVSKDGKESGRLASYEQLLPWGSESLMFAYFYEHYLILGDQQYFYRLDLNTGESCMLNDVLNIKKYVRFVAYDNGNYYYIVPDMENNGIGGTLYRKAEDSEEEQICFLPTLGIADIDGYSSFIPKGDYLYFADESSVFRIHMKNGSMEELAFHDGAYNRFALCDTGLYYFKDMSLHLLNLETLEETVFDLPESGDRNPEMIYAGQDDDCWFKQWVGSFDYCHFRPNESTGSFVFLNGSIREDESTQDASADNQEAANTTALYADVVNQTIAEHGTLGFQETQFDCIARGVFKIDLLDFNQDGTEELLMMYSNESDSAFPVIEVWTVKNGEAALAFSGRSRVESQEPIFGFNLYQNAGNLYVPVFDSLDCNPVYVHLYGFDENGEFREIYQYENNEFYMNQLPDGMEFTDYDKIPFYVDSLRDDFEGDKTAMKELLQADMADILNRLGITMPENSQEDAISTYDYEGDWVWKRENSDMEGTLHLEVIDESTFSGAFGVYRLFSEQLTITMSGNTGTVTSETGEWDGTAEFGADYILLHFEDVPVLGASSISEGFGTTEFRFVPAS